ncbi:MAG TPA: RNA polymerase sigma factor [Planctomycetota bacterium]|nr:RNA polymerase sigma factor [Planctomycetota bacterium]
MGSRDEPPDPLEALRRGDTAPFEAFVADWSGRLVGFFRRLGAGRSEAEDLTQDVFLKVYRSTSTYQARSALGSYVLRVARNAWIDRRRRQAARPASGGLDSARDGEVARELRDPHAEDPTRRVEVREAAARLRAALARLPSTHSEVFELAVLQERPYAEISELLGIPVGTVKSRVFHALRKLRAELGDES